MGALPFLLCFLLIRSVTVTPVTKENLWVGDLALSGDGTRLAYTLQGPKESGKVDLWIRDTVSLHGEKISPPALFSSGMIFAPDGKSLYFIAPDKAKAWENNLYQWPLSGGEPKKIASRVDGPIEFSPDRTSFAFLRNMSHSGTALIVRNVASGTERTFAEWSSRVIPRENPAWSPDGAQIACPGYREMLLVSTQTGAIKKVAAQGFPAGLAWPAHGGLFALVGGHIARYDFSRGSWETVTDESERYGGGRIAATPDGSTLVAMRLDDVTPFVNWITGTLFRLKSLNIYYCNVVLIHLAG
jgi:hypothetical protein